MIVYLVSHDLVCSGQRQRSGDNVLSCSKWALFSVASTSVPRKDLTHCQNSVSPMVLITGNLFDRHELTWRFSVSLFQLSKSALCLAVGARLRTPSRRTFLASALFCSKCSILPFRLIWNVLKFFQSSGAITLLGFQVVVHGQWNLKISAHWQRNDFPRILLPLLPNSVRGESIFRLVVTCILANLTESMPISRIILWCLEREPKNRPSGTFSLSVDDLLTKAFIF